MSCMQNSNTNPMAHSKSSQIPYFMQTSIHKKLVAEADPINIYIIYIYIYKEKEREYGVYTTTNVYI